MSRERPTRQELVTEARYALNELLTILPERTVTALAPWIDRLRQSIAALGVHNVPLGALPPAGHVRVRIAVAVTHTGAWRAWGLRGAGDSEAGDQALEGLEDNGAIQFIEAFVPVPHTEVVEGVLS